MQLLLLAMTGGALGAGARYLINVACAACLAPTFPWGTFIINVLGSFLMGVVMASVGPVLGNSAPWRIFLATGILGGFTTFSAFSLETFQLMERNQVGLALIYAAGSVILGVLALAGGLGLMKAVLR